MISSVYVHAPFCARRCFYCDFAVQVRRTPDPEPWIWALGRELRLLEEEGRVVLSSPLQTLYVGGGTPSLLGPDAMARLGEVLGSERLEGGGLEWTAEANPESFSSELARGWARAGLNRVSLGVQSFQEPALRWMGRLHGPAGARDAVAAARAAGIVNVSVDLIFGLPARLERHWRLDLEAAVRLEVPHISLYGLTAEEGTPLGRSVAAGRTALADEERYRDEYLEAHRFLTAEGFVHYEVSNFARPGHESRHNQRYWDGSPYLGLGNSSHSHIPPVRRWNLREWDAYVECVERGRLPLADTEEVDGEAGRLERIWLGLRCATGVSAAVLAAPAARDLSREWCRRGIARMGNGRLVLTAEGWLLLDRLAVELAQATAGTGSA